MITSTESYTISGITYISQFRTCEYYRESRIIQTGWNWVRTGIWQII